MSDLQNNKHSFVICAYKESPYLEECIKSLLAQTVKSRILVATSTPNDYIGSMTEKYGLRLRVNDAESSLAGDWNFALEAAQTELVTLAHQDDVYLPEYAQKVTEAYRDSRDPILLFTDYCELREGKVIKSNRLLQVKRMLLSPLKIKALRTSRFVRRRILASGSAICCPTVTIVKGRATCPLFKDNMKSNIDWQAWEELSRERGSFVYVPDALVLHRIHDGSTTTEILQNSARKEEDIFMYQKFWPKPIARLIEVFYGRNEKYNHIENIKEK